MQKSPKLNKKHFSGFLKNIRIPERLAFEDWCEKNVSLSSDFASISGPFSLALTPYMKFVYACLDHDSLVEEVTLLMGSQLGKTQMMLNWMLYRQAERPGPMMFVLPTIKVAQTFSKQRVTTMFDGTPVLRRKLEKSKGRAASQTMSIKRFPGGFVMLVGSNSRSDLASTPIRDLLMDEIDRYCEDVGGEGSPIGLAEKRTTSFHNSVKIKSSTPTIRGESNVEDSFEKSTRYYFFVPCPDCSHMQILIIDNLKEDGYQCDLCQELIDDREHKSWMLENGEWRTKDPPSRHYGFHLSQLYAPYIFVSWEEILKEKAEAEVDVEKLKVFVNTALAQSYQEAGESAKWQDVKERASKDYREKVVPHGTIAITMAVDCQKDYLEYEVRAWKRRLVSYSIDKGIILGAIGEESAQKKLSELLNSEYKAEDGGAYGINRTLIDSSYDTVDVYSFCRLHHRDIISPIKGREDQDFPISAPVKAELRISGKKINPRGLWFYKIGVSILKKRIYATFNMDEEDYKNEKTWRRIFFPLSYDQEWYEQICSEQLIDVRNKITNRSKKVWKKMRDRNEALDLCVYNLAAAHLLQLDDKDVQSMRKKVSKKKAPQKRKRNPPAKVEIGI